MASGEASRGVLRNSARAARGPGEGVRPRRMGRDVTREGDSARAARVGKEDVGAEVDGWRHHSRKAVDRIESYFSF